LESEQLAVREWFQRVQTQDLGELTFPGFPYHFTRLEPAVRTPAPRLGQHTDEVRERGWGEVEARAPTAAAPTPGGNGANPGADGAREAAGEDDLPLAGLRVIEVTANWAGPLGGRHFGDLGAEVI